MNNSAKPHAAAKAAKVKAAKSVEVKAAKVARAERALSSPSKAKLEKQQK